MGQVPAAARAGRGKEAAAGASSERRSMDGRGGAGTGTWTGTGTGRAGDWPDGLDVSCGGALARRVGCWLAETTVFQGKPALEAEARAAPARGAPAGKALKPL